MKQIKIRFDEEEALETTGTRAEQNITIMCARAAKTKNNNPIFPAEAEISILLAYNHPHTEVGGIPPIKFKPRHI